MGLLKDLRQKAAQWLTPQAKVPTYKNVVVQQNIDRRVIERAFEESKYLVNLADKFEDKFGLGQGLVADLMQAFWQTSPTVRPLSEMHAGYERNHAVISDILTSPLVQELRSITNHDVYSSIMATLSVADSVEKFFEAQDELAQAQEEAKKAAESADKAVEALSSCDEQADLIDGYGDPTAAQEALECALEDVEVASQCQQQAEQAVQRAVGQCAANMDRTIRVAMEQAKDDLMVELETFHAWGINDGELQKMPFQERYDLAQKLKSNRFAKFAKLIGRRRLAATAMRTKKTQYGRDEVIDVEFSGDLERVLQSEFILSCLDERFEAEFVEKLVENRLLSRKFIGAEHLERGAIIALCDTSASTTTTDKHGIPREVWIKATALCLLDQAKHDKRDFVWVSFSSENQIQEWYFPKGEGSITQLIECVEHKWNGGTSYEAPLNRGVRILAGQALRDIKNGDQVLITDGACKVNETWFDDFRLKKDSLGFRVFGIMCGTDRVGDGDLALVSDTIQIAEEFSDPNDISGLIRQL